MGFPSVEAYYEASSGLHILPRLAKQTLIIYAADDPLFAPSIVPDLQTACDCNPAINLILTRYGGVGDPDPCWAWN